MIVLNSEIKFAIWRYALLFLVFYFWKEIIKCIGAKQKWHRRVIIKLIKMRWRLIVFFICFEVFIVYGGFTWVLTNIISFF